MTRFSPIFTMFMMVAVFALVTGCGGDGSDKTKPAADKTKPATDKTKPATDKAAAKKNVTIAYLTNGVDPFWDLAAGGVKRADQELDHVETLVGMPPNATVDEQKQYIEAWIAKGVNGIAISPINAANQVDNLNKAAETATIITQDSDAPDSKRLVFIGVDNYEAGRAAGKLVKKALPDGGKIMIFVGRLGQLNARQRRQGVIDEVLDRPVQQLESLEYDENDAKDITVEGSKYIILDTRTDNFDKGRAKQNAEDAITTVSDLGCMVGLFAYNTPACLLAVKAAGKQGKIKLVSFDEDADTLEGIVDGHVTGTISQQPWNYGYKSVMVLDAILQGDMSVIPDNKFIKLELKTVVKENVQEFWAQVKEMMDMGKQGG
jgi:ribose transport system substrate-binding protein